MVHFYFRAQAAYYPVYHGGHPGYPHPGYIQATAPTTPTTYAAAAPTPLEVYPPQTHPHQYYYQAGAYPSPGSAYSHPAMMPLSPWGFYTPEVSYSKLSSLCKGTNDLQQNGMQEGAPLFCTVFDALACGIVCFALDVSSRNYFLISSLKSP